MVLFAEGLDSIADCDHRVERGECDGNPGYMLPKCCASCKAQSEGALQIMCRSDQLHSILTFGGNFRRSGRRSARVLLQHRLNFGLAITRECAAKHGGVFSSWSRPKDIRLWKIAPSLLPMITPDRISDMLLMQRGKCIYRHCGADMTYGPAVDRRMGDAVSLERIDNNIGHVRENCVLACVRCNKRRADRLSFDEFDALPSQ